jgi:hypothetical protein
MTRDNLKIVALCVVCGIAFFSILAMILLFSLLPRLRDASDIAAIHRDFKGKSRAEVYRWLRVHGRVAYNYDMSHESAVLLATGMVKGRVDNGLWPEPGVPPPIPVEGYAYSKEAHRRVKQIVWMSRPRIRPAAFVDFWHAAMPFPVGACGAKLVVEIDFNDREKVSQISDRTLPVRCQSF